MAEDPVTGNGHGPLGAYPVRHSRLPPLGAPEFTGRQGEAMRWPGKVQATVETAADGSHWVSIMGDAVTAFRAELS
ncbi:PhzF family phenazine biosynthesis protein [Streptomyces sp. NPDC042319]|uniref:PhzF family phenazine biosynthesis protein n=1 Tax=Streptomyces sp. NPDC042319 TaxID=3154332 RepID=UPI00340B8BF6